MATSTTTIRCHQNKFINNNIDGDGDHVTDVFECKLSNPPRGPFTNEDVNLEDDEDDRWSFLLEEARLEDYITGLSRRRQSIFTQTPMPVTKKSRQKHPLSFVKTVRFHCERGGRSPTKKDISVGNNIIPARKRERKKVGCKCSFLVKYPNEKVYKFTDAGSKNTTSREFKVVKISWSQKYHSVACLSTKDDEEKHGCKNQRTFSLDCFVSSGANRLPFYPSTKGNKRKCKDDDPFSSSSSSSSSCTIIIVDAFVREDKRRLDVKYTQSKKKSEKKAYFVEPYYDRDVNLIYRVYLVTVDRLSSLSDQRTTLLASEYIKASRDSEKAIREVEEAKLKYILPSYQRRVQKNPSCEHAFNLLFAVDEEKTFSIIEYDNNTVARKKKPYHVLSRDKKEYEFTFSQIEYLRRNDRTRTSLDELKRNELRVIERWHEMKFGCSCVENLKRNLNRTSGRGDIFYIVNLAAGCGLASVELYDQLKRVFPNLRIKCILVDNLYEFKKSTNQYRGTLKSLSKRCMQTGSRKEALSKMEQIEERNDNDDDNDCVFEYYKLDYFESYEHSFYRLRGYVLMCLLSPKCSGFSIAKIDCTPEDLKLAIIGIIQTLSFMIACDPIAFALESCGTKHDRMLANQPIMQKINKQLPVQGYTHCKFTDDASDILKLTHCWSNLNLNLPKPCTCKDPCPLRKAGICHRDLNSLSASEKAVWPPGFRKAIAGCCIEELLRRIL